MKQIVADTEQPTIEVSQITKFDNIIIKDESGHIGIVKNDKRGNCYIVWSNAETPAYTYSNLKTLMFGYPTCKFYQL